MDKDLLYTKVKDWCCPKLISLHKWIQNRPLIVSFLLSCSSILFSFLLVFCGDQIPAPFTLTFFDSKDHLRLTNFGLLSSIICITWTFLLEASEKYYEYERGEDATNAEITNYIRERVDTRIITVCNNKYNTLIRLVSDIINEKAKPRYIISKPCEQLKTITKELAACLRSLLVHNGYNLNENDMYVSIFYKFHTFPDWRQTHSAFPETGASIESVTSDGHSTFSQTLNSKNGVIFINDKDEGMRNRQYVPDKDDKYDKDGKLKGSILCYRIICKKDGIDYITAILSISTYVKRIEPDNDLEKINNTRDNICKYIIETFEKRIKIELCLVYLAELYNSKHKRISPTVKSHDIQSTKVQE